ncbi:hypothetical protein DPMN_027539 [Dreissena polymorpha]|uniref:C1q domain-containing protein n=1 Tax=Dreissena polymorpha TaxID=45954 RepID=A0A9D4LVE8_DREPO|nr:hypothetical protein DPMN_027539 [Dreissena polymorpha]
MPLFSDVPQKRSVLAEPQVAFYAQSTHGRINVGEHQTIVFDQVVTNVGNAYNKFSGMFTAPVSGTYAIFWSTFNGHHTHLLSELVHNANVVGLAWSDAYDHDDGEMASNQAVLPMNAGDIAYVRSAPYNPPCVADGRSFTTFSGWLLYLA